MLKNFRCKRCGECCHSPRLYKADIKRIEKAGIKDFYYMDNFEVPYINDVNDWCMFLKRIKNKISCKIYNYRPKICRQYPSRLIKGSCKPEKLASDKLFEK